MGDCYLMICKTCKTATWWAEDLMPDYIERHQGHIFTAVKPDMRDDDDSFREWFLKFMGWPKEAEG